MKPEKSTKTAITKDECFITPDVHDTQIKFKIDTGSQANIIPMSLYEKIKEPKAPIQTSKTTLTSYTGDKLDIIGKCTLKCNDKPFTFFISQTEQPAILGFQAWGSDEQEHDRRLEATLQKCEEINLTLNEQKCKFKVKQVSYCGHKFTKDGVKPDDSKIKTIQDMPAPSSKKDVERLLGL